MAGLLDLFNSPEGQQALGLLAAGGPQTDPSQTGFGQRLAAASGFEQQWKKRQADAEMQNRQMELLRQKMDETAAMAGLHQEQASQLRAKAAQEQRNRELIARAGQIQPGMGATDQVNDALPADMRIGAQPALQQAGKIDYTSLMQQGVPFDSLKDLAATRNLGREEVARVQEVEGPNGQKVLQGFDKFGRPVDQGVNGYTAPQLVNLGNRQVFAKPSAGVSMDIGQSPDSVASNATTRRGQDLVNARARDAQEQTAAAGGKPQFHDGQWVFPPGAANPNGSVVQVPGYQKPLGETAKKTLSGIESLNGAIGEYVNELKGWSNGKALSPDARAAMGTKYNNMMLQAKEAYNLGVLNGPDYEILQAVITDPRSLKGAFTSNKALGSQATELSRIMSTVTAPAIRDSGAKAETTGTAKPVATIDPPQAAINHLKMKPALRAEFDAKYGDGAAARILGK